MKLPSITNLYNGAKSTFSRFPFVIIFAILATIFMIWCVDLNMKDSSAYFYLINAAMAASLGIPLSFAFTITSENKNYSKAKSLVLQVILIILLIIYFITLSHQESLYDAARYMLFLIAAHLLVSFCLFEKDREALVFKSFWDFNLELFMRFLIAAFYSFVLFAGLAIAVLSFDKLFNIELKGIRYMQLFFIIGGIFNTWFFLSDIPDKNSKVSQYPNSIKIFTQYVAIPIVIVYLFILYLYMGKIIIQWQLPVGWVSNLIIGFSITGIFSLLLVHPLKNTMGNKWISKFGKIFYFIIIPLIVLLYFAILTRTNEYGITENRYYVFLTAMWLTGITLYNILSKNKNIKIIPISLFVVLLLSSFGPWGAFSLSLNNQVSRLEGLLKKNNILVNEKIIKASISPSDEDVESIYSIITFLKIRNKYSEIQKWFDLPLDTLDERVNKKLPTKISETKIMNMMGIEYSGKNYNKEKGTINFSADLSKGYSIKGYNYLNQYYYYTDSDTLPKTIFFDSVYMTIGFSKATSTLKIISYSDSLKTPLDTILIGNDIIWEKLKNNKNKEILFIEKESNKLKTKILITEIYGEIKESILNIRTLTAVILFTVKSMP